MGIMKQLSQRQKDFQVKLVPLVSFLESVSHTDLLIGLFFIVIIIIIIIIIINIFVLNFLKIFFLIYREFETLLHT